MSKIYNYDAQTGQYISTDIADSDPMNEGEFLIPAFATTVEVNKPKANFNRIFDVALNKWIYVLDESTCPSPAHEFDKKKSSWVLNENKQAEIDLNQKKSNWLAYQSKAQSLLTKSDISVLRCAENNITVPIELKNYRESLREIIRASSGDTTINLPAQPDSPLST